MSRRGSVLEGYQAPKALTFDNQMETAKLLQDEGQFQQKLGQEKRQHADANKLGLYKMAADTYNPDDKAHLTGTAYDPMIHQGIADLNNKAVQMIKSGVTDWGIIQTTLAKDAMKLGAYQTKAAQIKNNVDLFLKELPETGEYDKPSIRSNALGMALLDENGKIKDNIDLVDEKKNWAADAIEKNPLQTTTNKGLGTILKNEALLPTSEKKVQWYDPKSRTVKTKDVVIDAPSGWIPEVDENGRNKMVPKYEIATDNGNPIVHTFKDASGKAIQAPVRMVTDEYYDRVRNSSHSYASNLDGEIRQHLGEYKRPDGSQITPDSPEYRNIGKALLYTDAVNQFGERGVKDKTLETKPAPIRVTVNTGTGTGTKINDVFGDIVEATKNADIIFPNTNVKGTRMNTLNADARKVIFDYIGDKDLDERNTFIVNDNGKPKVYRLNENSQPELNDKYLITTLPEVGTNIKVQPNAKAKVAVVQKGNTPIKTFKIINPKTGAVVMEGVDEDAAKKATAKGYKVQ